MNLMFAANSSSSLDSFLQKLPKKVDPKDKASNSPSEIIEKSIEANNSASTTVTPEPGIFDTSLADIFSGALNALPLALIFSVILTFITIFIWRFIDSKRSKAHYLTTITPKHYRPDVFRILGKQCHLLAYRTGYGFALMSIRLADEKIPKKQHDEMAFCLASCLREDDIIGDYGNGHFKILLPYLADVVDYEIVKFRLRSRLKRTSIAVNSVEYSATVFPDGGSTFKQMLRASNRNFKSL